MWRDPSATPRDDRYNIVLIMSEKSCGEEVKQVQQMDSVEGISLLGQLARKAKGNCQEIHFLIMTIVFIALWVEQLEMLIPEFKQAAFLNSRLRQMDAGNHLNKTFPIHIPLQMISVSRSAEVDDLPLPQNLKTSIRSGSSERVIRFS